MSAKQALVLFQTIHTFKEKTTGQKSYKEYEPALITALQLIRTSKNSPDALGVCTLILNWSLEVVSKVVNGLRKTEDVQHSEWATTSEQILSSTTLWEVLHASLETVLSHDDSFNVPQSLGIPLVQAVLYVVNANRDVDIFTSTITHSLSVLKLVCGQDSLTGDCIRTTSYQLRVSFDRFVQLLQDAVNSDKVHGKTKLTSCLLSTMLMHSINLQLQQASSKKTFITFCSRIFKLALEARYKANQYVNDAVRVLIWDALFKDDHLDGYKSAMLTKQRDIDDTAKEEKNYGPLRKRAKHGFEMESSGNTLHRSCYQQELFTCLYTLLNSSDAYIQLCALEGLPLLLEGFTVKYKVFLGRRESIKSHKSKEYMGVSPFKFWHTLFEAVWALLEADSKEHIKLAAIREGNNLVALLLKHDIYSITEDKNDVQLEIMQKYAHGLVGLASGPTGDILMLREEFTRAISIYLNLNHQILHSKLLEILVLIFKWGGKCSIDLIGQLLSIYSRLRQLDDLIKQILKASLFLPEKAADFIFKSSVMQSIESAFKNLPEGQVESAWIVCTDHYDSCFVGNDSNNVGRRNSVDSNATSVQNYSLTLSLNKSANEITAGVFAALVRNIRVSTRNSSVIIKLVRSVMSNQIEPWITWLSSTLGAYINGGDNKSAWEYDDMLIRPAMELYTAILELDMRAKFWSTSIESIEHANLSFEADIAFTYGELNFLGAEMIVKPAENHHGCVTAIQKVAIHKLKQIHMKINSRVDNDALEEIEAEAKCLTQLICSLCITADRSYSTLLPHLHIWAQFGTSQCILKFCCWLLEESAANVKEIDTTDNFGTMMESCENKPLGIFTDASFYECESVARFIVPSALYIIYLYLFSENGRANLIDAFPEWSSTFRGEISPVELTMKMVKQMAFHAEQEVYVNGVVRVDMISAMFKLLQVLPDGYLDDESNTALLKVCLQVDQIFSSRDSSSGFEQLFLHSRMLTAKIITFCGPSEASIWLLYFIKTTQNFNFCNSAIDQQSIRIIFELSKICFVSGEFHKIGTLENISTAVDARNRKPILIAISEALVAHEKKNYLKSKTLLRGKTIGDELGCLICDLGSSSYDEIKNGLFTMAPVVLNLMLYTEARIFLFSSIECEVWISELLSILEVNLKDVCTTLTVGYVGQNLDTKDTDISLLSVLIEISGHYRKLRPMLPSDTFIRLLNLLFSVAIEGYKKKNNLTLQSQFAICLLFRNANEGEMKMGFELLVGKIDILCSQLVTEKWSLFTATRLLCALSHLKIVGTSGSIKKLQGTLKTQSKAIVELLCRVIEVVAQNFQNEDCCTSVSLETFSESILVMDALLSKPFLPALKDLEVGFILGSMAPVLFESARFFSVHCLEAQNCLVACAKLTISFLKYSPRQTLKSISPLIAIAKDQLRLLFKLVSNDNKENYSAAVLECCNLFEHMKPHSIILRSYAVPLLVEFVALASKGSAEGPTWGKKGVARGGYALISLCRSHELQLLHTKLDESSRSVFRSLYEDYRRQYKYRGEG